MMSNKHQQNTKEPTSSIVDQFSTVGTTEIKESENSIIGTMRAIFEMYPDKYYTQRDFVEHLNRTNPFVNKNLHKLMAQNVIERIKVTNRFHYRLVKN